MLYKFFKTITLGILSAIFLASLPALATAGSGKSKVNPFESGFISGAATTRLKNPSVLGPKGIGKRTASTHTVRTARIAFQRIKGGLDYHQAIVNQLVPRMAKQNGIRIVGLNQNPTHIIKGRILARETSSAPVVSYRWTILNPENGKKLQYFVDNERGARVRLDTPWRGIGELEIRKVTKTAADRLAYWLNGGA